ncbi:UDP-N-acetylmuramate--L-alanine ligase [Candidatus Peregrinibacteria bacterium]|nr:UDP-N-acetylmuramate--L-alanine ligase [Candidatus Peregrinibacteria bacterium]
MASLFFSGIGGIGMSALAQFLHQHGVNVSGSDQSDSEILHDLEASGISVSREQKAENLPHDISELIYTEAVPPENPERREAAKRKIPQKSYFEKLGEISRDYFTIAIAGTHGKSTTTAMTALALEAVGFRPNVLLGTKVFEWGKKNFRIGKSNILIVEACEYRESFLHLHPNIIVLTSIDSDHLDYYKTKERYDEGFRKFLAKLSADGVVILSSEGATAPSRLYGNRTYTQIDASKFLDAVPEMKIPGNHNRQNASKVLALFSVLELDLEIAKKSLGAYRGSWRRFEEKGEKNGILVIDDYGHHPTEIRATLSALKEKFPNRKKWIVFEPHQYSRTFTFLEEFGKSFPDVDEILIPGIYRVRDSEKDVKKVSPQILVEEIAKNLRSDQRVRYSESYEKTIEILNAETKAGDVILTIGAGPVNEVGEGVSQCKMKNGK